MNEETKSHDRNDINVKVAKEKKERPTSTAVYQRLRHAEGKITKFEKEIKILTTELNKMRDYIQYIPENKLLRGFDDPECPKMIWGTTIMYFRAIEHDNIDDMILFDISDLNGDRVIRDYVMKIYDVDGGKSLKEILDQTNDIWLEDPETYMTKTERKKALKHMKYIEWISPFEEEDIESVKGLVKQGVLESEISRDGEPEQPETAERRRERLHAEEEALYQGFQIEQFNKWKKAREESEALKKSASMWFKQRGVK